MAGHAAVQGVRWAAAVGVGGAAGTNWRAAGAHARSRDTRTTRRVGALGKAGAATPTNGACLCHGRRDDAPDQHPCPRCRGTRQGHTAEDLAAGDLVGGRLKLGGSTSPQAMSLVRSGVVDQQLVVESLDDEPSTLDVRSHVQGVLRSGGKPLARWLARPRTASRVARLQPERHLTASHRR
jgi:hypothetical protein